MESSRSLAIVLLLMSFLGFACSLTTSTEAVLQVTSAAPTVEATVERTTPTAAPLMPTQAAMPTETATPEPSLTPTQTILELGILEWSEWPYANPADPSNTDTHVEVLIRNPNDFPVRVNTGADELRFLNAAGEVVYTNPSSFYYIWPGSWMLPGETAALSACVCFQTSGVEKQDWESLELIAPLEAVTDIAYTLDVEVTAEFVLLEEVIHGYSGPGVATTLANTSDQVLESIAFRVLARDNSGRYVGVATSGNAVASFTENTRLQPGDTASGLEVSLIDYVDSNERLTYEVAAIGILAQPARATEAFAWPTGTSTSPGEWKGIPLLPDAIGSELRDDEYQYATQTEFDEIVRFYETELGNRGFELESTVDENTGVARLAFRRGGMTGEVAIAPVTDGVHAVVIIIK